MLDLHAFLFSEAHQDVQNHSLELHAGVVEDEA